MVYTIVVFTLSVNETISILYFKNVTIIKLTFSSTVVITYHSLNVSSLLLSIMQQTKYLDLTYIPKDI